MKIEVLTEELRTHYHREDVEWGSWSEQNDCSITGAKIADEDCWRFIEVPDGIMEPGGTVYIPYIIYGTGDSFGHSYGNLCPLHVFKDVNLAQQAVNEVKKDRDSWNESHFKMKDDAGKELEIYDPTSGYFECLEHADIKVVTLMPA
jgi:hypothetical protein